MEKLSRHTDEELVKLYVEGLNEAFDTLLLRYKDRLFGYILSNVHDEDIANDIFQETFFKVIVSLRKGRYVENGKFYVWLSSIAHNVIVDSFRKQQTQECVVIIAELRPRERIARLAVAERERVEPFGRELKVK